MKKNYVNYDEVSKDSKSKKRSKNMKKIIVRNRAEYKWNGITYDFIASQENDEEITKEEFEKLNIIDDIDELKNYDNNTNYIIIDCYCLAEVDEDGEYGKNEVLGYDAESAEFTRGF